MTVADTRFDARPSPDPVEATDIGDDMAIEFSRPLMDRVAHPPLRLRPSDAVLHDGDVVVSEIDRLGMRIPLAGNPDIQLLGEAIHRFLAADDPAAGIDARTADAEAMLGRWGVPQVAASDLVLIADRLSAFVATRFAGSALLREWPVHAEDGLQVLSGRLDLLIDTGDGYAIVDHKSFPGSIVVDEHRLREFAGQALGYARAIALVTGSTRFEYWIHQPIAGTMTRVEIR